MRLAASVDEIVSRASAAQEIADEWNQARVDDVVAAVAWQLYEPSSVRHLAGLAFEETGLGNAAHLFELHRRRVLGALDDLHGVRTVGLIDSNIRSGTATYARPVGVIAMFSPATAPSSGIATNVLQALKTRNAAVVCPNPRASRTAEATVQAVRRGLANVSAPLDLVQWLDPESRDISEQLMTAADLVVAAGGPGLVRRAYRSGTPALSAGSGNATAIVDETADLDRAARLIVYGVGFNHGTSCSSESNVLVHDSAWKEFSQLLTRHGAYICDDQEGADLARVIWTADGELHRKMIGRSPAELADAARIRLPGGRTITALALPRGPGADPADVVFGPKLSPVFTLSAFADFDGAIRVATRQIGRSGPGHSCALHTGIEARAGALAERLEVCRVMINQSTAVGNSGSFDNGMPFTAVVSTGSWGGCSRSENITWRHLINEVTVSRTIKPRVPDERALFGAHAGAPGTDCRDDRQLEER